MNASVQGLQSVGVQASSKHFIANEQETQRTSSTSDDGTVVEAISENVDDRTLHELYIWPFADAVRAGTASVMCSYNRVNGSYACANSHTIITILKDELAFPGYVISDWYATHSTASSANAGLDIEMPGNVSALAGPAYFGDALLQNVQNGTVKEARLVEMAERVMTPYFLLGQDQDYPSLDPSNGASFWVYQYGHANVPSIYPQVDARDVRADHAKIIREVGAAGTVLLKNVNGALPLKSEKNVGVFGNDAPYPTTGSVFHDTGVHPEEGYEMGTLDIGGGSGTVRHTDIITPLEAIREQVASIGGRVQVLLGNDEVAEGSFKTIYPVPDVCLLFLNAYATEGIDRASLDLQWNATRAVESTAALCNNTVVIVHGPGVVLMPWADNENVTAILSAHFPGDQTGNSIVDVLWGVTEPSGRLPYSLPKAAADAGPPIVNLTGVTGVVDWQSNFTEGQMIDYRYYDQNDIEPLYEFGFGLSYVPFEMPDSLKIQITSNISFTADQSKGIAPGGLVDLWTTVATATIEVANTVDREASTVPQLFVSFPQDTTPSGTPVKVLRGFETVSIQSGETKEVQFALTRRDLSYWNTDQKQWVIPNGTFIFRAGFSSRDLKSEVELSVLG
ncbi:putative beta-glucosidase 2 protein [Eutypa lata UCREL1]|uniref:Probable beta-glucosidase G n=1 Tax=Eutypa lata (strain UCR-EL1) TaxID=1287681 RepID=M7SFX2_EUTLA|nr:putative beta-glucosidase 2 protein [Eutypa lata UCREL1]